MERLLGEITVKPYPRKRELELEFGLVAEALPSVIPAGRANAYIVVAGASFVCRFRPIELRKDHTP